MKVALALWIASLSVATAQQPPASPCEFDGFDMNSKLAEMIKSGDPFVVTRGEGDWTCGYLDGRKGSAQRWVRSKDIRSVPLDPNPPLAAWVGTWVQGDNRIRIQNSKTDGKLEVEGEAYWHGFGDNVHEGQFSAHAKPSGNHLHVEDDLCHVDLALWGKYLLLNDNNMCGGMNVRFWSVWRRVRFESPLK